MNTFHTAFMGHAGYVNYSRIWHFKMFGSFNQARIKKYSTGGPDRVPHGVIYSALYFTVARSAEGSLPGCPGFSAPAFLAPFSGQREVASALKI